MAGLNKFLGIGRLGQDPEFFMTQAGLAITKFSIAASETWFDKKTGQKQEKTEWIRCVSFGKQAETLEKYLSKGSQVYIEGRLQTSSYEKDGQTRYTTEIVIANFQFLGGGRQNNQQNSNQSQNNQNSYYGNGPSSPVTPGVDGSYDDDDIPF